MMCLKFRTSSAPAWPSSPVPTSPDWPQDDLDIYRLDGEDADQQELSAIFSLINFLMFSETLTTAALLLGMNDVKFLAGSRRFLELYGGDLEEQRRKFRNFINSMQKRAPELNTYISDLRWAYLTMGVDDLDPYSPQ